MAYTTCVVELVRYLLKRFEKKDLFSFQSFII